MTPKPCGIELVRDCALTFNVDMHRYRKQARSQWPEGDFKSFANPF